MIARPQAEGSGAELELDSDADGEAPCQNIGLGKVDHAEVSDKSPRRNIDKGEVDVTEAGVVLKCWRGKVDGRGPHQQRR